MQQYIHNYLNFFGIGEQDILLSEVSGLPAQDIHHIKWRSAGGGDEVENLIALTRLEHDRAHFKKKPFLYEEELIRIHKMKMNFHLGIVSGGDVHISEMKELF